MANGPDFTVKTKAIDPTALADILLKRREIENQQNQQALNNSNDRMKRIMDAITTGQTVANNMMTLAEKRQTLADQQTASQGQAKVQQILSSPEPQVPAPTATSMAGADQGNPIGTTPVMPSPEQTQNYQSAIQKRKNDLSAALVQADRKGVSDILAKQQFEKQKLDLDPKDMLVDGTRSALLYDKTTGKYYDTNSRQPITGHISPIIPAADDTEITDIDRKQLTPLAQKLVDGTAKAGDLVNARGNRKEKVSRIAAEIDPNFDPTTVPQRIAVRKDFAPGGKSSANLTSQNTIIGHLDTLDKAIDALDNKQIPKYNTIKNYLSKNVGKPEVSQFLAAKSAVSNEMGKQFQGSGVVTNEERKDFSDALDSSSSPKQAHAVINTYMDLMKSRSDALKANWTQTMGASTPPTPFINEKSKTLLIKHGYNPTTLERTDNTSRPSLASFQH